MDRGATMLTVHGVSKELAQLVANQQEYIPDLTWKGMPDNRTLIRSRCPDEKSSPIPRVEDKP